MTSTIVERCYSDEIAVAQSQPYLSMTRRKILTEQQVRQELEKAIEKAGGVNALARAAGISTEPIVRARKRGGQIRPVVLTMLRLRKREVTYERVNYKGKS